MYRPIGQVVTFLPSGAEKLAAIKVQRFFTFKNYLCLFVFLGIQYIRKRLEESKILSNNDSSANFDDQSTTDFYMKKSKDHALEIYLTSANHDLTIYDEQCASLRNLALELNAPIQTSAICRNMFRSSVGLNSRSQWSNLPDCHYEAFLLNNCNRSFI